MNQTMAGMDQVVFGTPTDNVVPGDYDGDGKTDIAVARSSAGQYNWYVRPSMTGAISGSPYAIFGASASDFLAQGIMIATAGPILRSGVQLERVHSGCWVRRVAPMAFRSDCPETTRWPTIIASRYVGI